MAETKFLGEQHKKFSESILDLLKDYQLITEDELVQGLTIESNSEKSTVYLRKTRCNDDK